MFGSRLDIQSTLPYVFGESIKKQLFCTLSIPSFMTVVKTGSVLKFMQKPNQDMFVPVQMKREHFAPQRLSWVEIFSPCEDPLLRERGRPRLLSNLVTSTSGLKSGTYHLKRVTWVNKKKKKKAPGCKNLLKKGCLVKSDARKKIHHSKRKIVPGGKGLVHCLGKPPRV